MAPGSVSPATAPGLLLQLQRTAGNAATVQLIGQLRRLRQPGGNLVLQRLDLVRTDPPDEAIRIKTDNLKIFKEQVMAAVRRNEELVYVIHDELVAAIGWDPALRAAHVEHLTFVGDLIDRVEQSAIARKALLAEEQAKKELAARNKEKREQAKLKQDQQRLRTQFKNIPRVWFDTVFAWTPTPPEAVLEMLDDVVVAGPGDPQVRCQLAWDAVSKAGASSSAIRRLLTSVVLSIDNCRTVVSKFPTKCSIELIDACELAIQSRGGAPGQVPASLSNENVINLVFVHEVDAACLSLLSYAPDRDAGQLVPAIKRENLTRQDVEKIAAAPNISLTLCLAALAHLRSLSLPRVVQLNAAFQSVRAGGGTLDAGLIGTIATALIQGVPGLDAALLVRYIAGTVLYTNLDAATIRRAIETNAQHADLMLGRFNERAAGCTATIRFDDRSDLGAPGGPGTLYAPVAMGTWNLHSEIVADLFGWRGAGSSHGCFTFEQLREALARFLGSLQGAAPDFNEQGSLYVGGKQTTMVVNRGQRKLITAYTA